MNHRALLPKMAVRWIPRWILGGAVAVAALTGSLAGCRLGTLLPTADTTSFSRSSDAQSVVGAATVARVTALGQLASAGDTGYLSGPSDARAISAGADAVPFVGSAEALHAATISSVDGWDTWDEVVSTVSLANLDLTVATRKVAADFVIAEVTAPVGGTSQVSSTVVGMIVDGQPITPSGAMNQKVSVAGLALTFNEVVASGIGTTVNAIHIESLDGSVDVVIGSATAGTSTTSPPAGLVGDEDSGVIGGLLGL